MKARYVIAALRNYGRAVFFRDNPYALLALLFIAVFVVQYGALLKHGPVHQGQMVVDLFRQANVSKPWWMLCMMLPAGLTMHYWRQVSGPFVSTIPHFLRAEYCAIFILLPFFILALALPFILAGAPVFGALAITCCATVWGGVAGAGGAKGHSLLLSRGLRILFGLFVIVGFIPGVLWWVLFAPLWVTLPLTCLTLALTVLGLLYFPARAVLQMAEIEHRHDVKSRKLDRPRVRAVVFCRRLLLWRPSFLRQETLPNTMVVKLGPVGQIIFMVVIIIFATGIVFIGAHGQGLRHWRQALPMSLPMMGMLVMAPLTSWLFLRQEWPFLYLAGRYGTRQSFARRLFRAQLRILLETAGLVGVVSVIAFLISGERVLEAIEGGVIAALLLFGLSYLVVVPLLWGELGGKGVTTIFIFVSILGFQMLYLSYIGGGAQHEFLWLLLAAAIALCGVGLGYVGPRRLAKIDWPLETP